MVPLMKKRNFTLLALSLSVLVTGFSGAALAQKQKKSSENDYLFNFGQEEENKDEEHKPVFNPYDPKHRPSPIPKVMCRCPSDLLSATDLVPSFVRGPDSENGYFTLRLSAPAEVTGCLEKKDAKIDITQYGPALKIKLSGEKIKTDQYTVRYAHYTCDPSSATASTDITLGRDQLIKDGIKEISFHVGEGLILGTYKLKINENMVEFERKALTPNPPEIEESQRNIFWFYPEGTYVLYAPDIDTGDKETARRLRILAEGKGLFPLEDSLPGFKPSYKNREKIYVVDKHGIYKGKTSNESPAFDIGFLEQTERYYGAGGPQDRPIKKTVMAKRPGLDE